MLLLVTTGHPDMERYDHPNLGRLLQPRHISSARTTAEAGGPWAADNDCFQGLDAPKYREMLAAITGLPGCLFVTVPDVVGDHAATLALWNEWHEEVAATGCPLGFVLQDECDEIPGDTSAVFIGGSTEFKLGPLARRLVLEAKERGLWVHMGRVNTIRRIRYAQSIGCDSIDGTKWAKWKATYLKKGLEACSHSMPTFYDIGGKA